MSAAGRDRAPTAAPPPDMKRGEAEDRIAAALTDLAVGHLRRSAEMMCGMSGIGSRPRAWARCLEP
jgi:hypothetical protein